MVDTTGAKSLYTFIVEPDTGGTTWNSRKMVKDTETVTNYNKASTMFQEMSDYLATVGGGRVGIRNGLYEIDDTDLLSDVFVQWGDPANADDVVDIILEGETREGVIIRCIDDTATESDLFGAYCSLELKNITLDGNDLGTHLNLLIAEDGTDEKRILRANNCEFLNHTGFGYRIPSNQVLTNPFLGGEVTNCVFRRPLDGNDQSSVHPDGWGKVIGNYYDTRDAGVSSAGSCITCGTALNIHISHNTIERSSDDINHGISVEPNLGVCENIIIDNNIVNYGLVKVGQSGSWPGTARNMQITNNIIVEGQTQLEGPTSGDDSTQLQYGTIKNNLLIGSPRYSLRVSHTAGLCEVKNNVVINSNSNLESGQSNACIRLNDCTNVICEDNTVYMGVTEPADVKFSPCGILFTNLTDSKIQNNRIYNFTTTPNPNYENQGGHSGTNVFSLNR